MSVWFRLVLNGGSLCSRAYKRFHRILRTHHWRKATRKHPWVHFSRFKTERRTNSKIISNSIREIISPGDTVGALCQICLCSFTCGTPLPRFPSQDSGLFAYRWHSIASNTSLDFNRGKSVSLTKVNWFLIIYWSSFEKGKGKEGDNTARRETFFQWIRILAQHRT